MRRPDRRPTLVFALALLMTAGLALTLGAGAAAAAGPYTVVAETTDSVGNLERTETTVVFGPNPIERFQIVRYSKPGPAEVKGTILFLPPLGPSFPFYEQTEGSGVDEARIGSSMAGYFAERGYEVWGYQPRYMNIPSGTCEAGVFDCSVMASWDIQAHLDDIAFIRQRIEAHRPGTGVVAGGASLGGMLAVGVANEAPDDYDGVLVWEGMLASDDPAVIALNAGYCAALEAQLAGGLVYDGVGPSLFKQVSEAARLAPQGTTAIPLFPPIFTNHQVMVLALSTPTPGPVSMPVPGYIQMNGSVADDELFFASEPRLHENVRRFTSYGPNATVRDVTCSLAGVETAYTSSLGSYTGSVLAIGGGRGFGAYMGHQLSLFGSTDVTFLLTPDFGHIDHFMTPDHREYVERPIFDWLQGLFGS
jgi:pimeloyl-ACP methyl ester carboxylesterase